MQIYVLITTDKKVGGIYSNKSNLINDLTTSLAATPIENVEVWDVDKGFMEYLKINRKTTVTFES